MNIGYFFCPEHKNAGIKWENVAMGYIDYGVSDILAKDKVNRALKPSQTVYFVESVNKQKLKVDGVWYYDTAAGYYVVDASGRADGHAFARHDNFKKGNVAWIDGSVRPARGPILHNKTLYTQMDGALGHDGCLNEGGPYANEGAFGWKNYNNKYDKWNLRR